MTKTGKLLFLSQFVLAAAIVVCTIILPQFLFSRDQGGISNYGVHRETIWPFTIGFIGCGLLVCAAALSLPVATAHRAGLRTTLLLVGGLTLLVAFSTYTYKVNRFFDLVHVYSAVLLFVAEVPLALWFALRLTKTTTARWLLGLFITGFILSGLTYFGLIHVLFMAETMTTFSFGVLMILAVESVSIPTN
ncbi:hypothetical protein IPL85_05755 [Candidatus Saccharibacteria bacterium]|nr:MAG: hypothetical protein IPL85_05755 [Candidatus Saccharibacteria bacterium]